MKFKFELWFRALLFLLVLVLAWTLWAGAPPQTTNAAPASPTNSPALIGKVTNERYLTFGLDRIDFLRERHFLGEPIWKYVASFIYVLIAFYAAKLLDLISLVWLKKLASKTKTKADDILLDLLHGPVKIIVFVLLLHVGLNIFDWSPMAKLWFSKGLILIVAGSLTYLALRIIDALLEIWARHHLHETDHKFNKQLFSIIRRSLNTFI